MPHDLYPESVPFASAMLAVQDEHTMYWEQCGNPQGQPVVLLHGGPGAGLDRWQQRLFDPRHYCIVSYDQRGAGRSTPPGETRDNTTAQLVSDIETLRQHLGLQRWLVFGGSWGSSLAIAYAETWPEFVSGLVLRGVFLCQQRELDWYFNGMRAIYPEAWRDFMQALSSDEQHDALAAYHRRLHDPDPTCHLPAAQAWCHYEAQCSTLLPPTNATQKMNEQQTLNLARIQSHYFLNGFFVTDQQLVNNIDRIRHIPGEIVQGRYDMICPVRSAEELHRAWPESNLRIVANAGHSASEPGIRRALVAATERGKCF